MDMSPLELRYRTAIEALASLDRAECDLAGFQVPVGEFERPILKRYAQWLDPDRHRLIHLAVRNTGMFVKPGNPKRIESVADMRNQHVRFVNRQLGTSTSLLVGLIHKTLDYATLPVPGFTRSN